MNDFKFTLLDRVEIVESGEGGQVIGRAEYSHAEPSYYVHYKAADGRAVQCWWNESALGKSGHGSVVNVTKKVA